MDIRGSGEPVLGYHIANDPVKRGGVAGPSGHWGREGRDKGEEEKGEELVNPWHRSVCDSPGGEDGYETGRVSGWVTVGVTEASSKVRSSKVRSSKVRSSKVRSKVSQR